MLKSRLCDYSDAWILVKGTITVPNTAATPVAVNNGNKKVIFKCFSPFTNCISKIKNTQVDNNAKGTDLKMVMHNVIEYSSNYSKTSETLWLYCRYKSAVNDESNIADFNVANGADSFNFKLKITDFTDNNGTKNVKIMVPL